jgi:uncharacterized protein YukJ
LVSDHDQFRIAINVKSDVEPSTVLYYVDEHFDHPVLKDLATLPFGFHSLESKPGGMALDFIRGNLFDTGKMKLLPYNLPGPDNDLNELLHKYVDRSIGMQNSVIYAFGSRWGPENKRDQYFDFLPGNGVHNIHMNQGNDKGHVDDDGPWRDGGVLFQLPDENRWVAVFLAFQSQCFHTDDTPGHKIPEACGAVVAGDKRLRIVAALVNPTGSEQRSITILNATPDTVSINGWKLVDREKKKVDLSGTLTAGRTMMIPITGANLNLPKDGGIITLLDNKGLKVDGVSYSDKDASKAGWTIVF